MPAPAIIHQLVNKFNENREAYRSGKYNEARLRQEFLDQFFIALGWDVYNTVGVAPEYADVIVEDSLDIEGTSKAPDYAFKIGRERKFYVEAKKPAVNIQYDIHPAYQLRRYAWNAGLHLSILTDFEEFAVYNCKAKPSPDDSAATARDLFFKYTEYIERWDEIAAIFSREAVWKGALDRYADASKGKKGTTAVDDEFLKDMNEWRVNLARNIALRNPHIADEHQLNYAVQMTIDRVIFLRICEDRGIEPEEQLKTLSATPGVYPRLLELFRRADVKYNSGLFHFNHEKTVSTAPDSFTPSLSIDDRVLKEFIKDIYYPCPYIFKEIPVEILGQVYEQFLGQVIRLTAGHQAKVEEKPEVRKAGGVYYTPRYIVDYIVANTVGKLLEGKTPLEAAALKIVDPACGSGSFLLGAFRYLIDWHEQWYLDNDPAKWAKGKNPALNEIQGGWRLTTHKKKEILLNNLHGVDIDAQAVEVTKLSLLLKVLEEESGQLSLGLERALPDLGRNIQCGNSLISEDYFAGQLVIDPAERRRVNPFDWQRAFPEVFSQGGFDAVIGNPPYGALVSGKEEKYLRYKFKVTEYQIDTYPIFIENSKNISRYCGIIGLIIPTAWSGSKFDEGLRKILLQETSIKNIVIAPVKTFQDATVETMILIFRSSYENGNSFSIERWDLLEKIDYQFFQDGLLKQPNYVIPLYSVPKVNELVNKIRNSHFTLSTFTKAVWGVKVYQKGKGKPPQKGYESEKKVFHSNVRTKNTHKPLIGGREISRYKIDWKGGYVDYGIWLAEPRTSDWFSGKRILIREVTANGVIQACFIEDDFVFSNSVDGIRIINSIIDYYFLLGLINSKLISFFHLNTSANAFKSAFPKLLVKDILNIPLPDISESSCNRISNLVLRMLDLHKQIASTPQEHEQLRREIESTDRQIDALVYQLYGLSDEEIRIVEGG